MVKNKPPFVWLVISFNLTFLVTTLLCFQDECNWILSGRDPLPDNIEEEDENTLDDISGDEVSRIDFKIYVDSQN